MIEEVEYNKEIWNRFEGILEKSCKNLSLNEETKKEIEQSLDLIKSVNSFRCYPDSGDFLKNYPTLKSQEHYVNLLWNHFSELSQKELSDLVIDMIHEIYNWYDKRGN